MVTLLYQVQDPNFFKGVFWVIVWFAVGIVYFALVGRHKLILSPEEEFALQHNEGARRRFWRNSAIDDGPRLRRRPFLHGRDVASWPAI